MVFRSAVDVVLIPAIVTDRQGRYVTDLAQDRFEIREDGVRQRVSYFSPPADGGLDLVVALDISGSMRDAMPALKRGVATLIETLAPDDVVTVLAFNDRVFELAERETDRNRLLELVAGLETSGYTSLYDAIGRSLGLLGGEPQRKAVLVFTDGDDRSSFSSLQAVERRVEESDATLYVVTLGRRSEVREVREVARRLTNVSGGQVFSVDRLDRLERALATFAGDLRHQYLLGFTPPPAASAAAEFRASPSTSGTATSACAPARAIGRRGDPHASRRSPGCLREGARSYANSLSDLGAANARRSDLVPV